MRRLGFREVGLVVVALCVLLVAASARAATVGVYPADDDPRFGYPPSIGINGDQRPEHISVGWKRSRGTYRLRDTQGLTIGFVTPEEHCARIDPNEVRCTSPERSQIWVRGTGGRDRIRIGRSVQASYINGGRRSDVLVGGWATDNFFGGPGWDLERGRRGPDYVGTTGDSGRDILRGGRGNDYVYARDDQEDRQISCGRGPDDSVRIDVGLDPDPVGCEHFLP